MDGLAMFHGPNAGYVLDLYDSYLRDPLSVDPPLRALFDTVQRADLSAVSAVLSAPAVASSPPIPGPGERASELVSSPPETMHPVPATAPRSTGEVMAIVNAVGLARNIRARGHLAALIDPLGRAPQIDPDLDMATNGLSADDLVALPAETVGGPVAAQAPNALEAIERLRVIYCRTTGYDYSHVAIAEERGWLREAVELSRFETTLSPEASRELLQRLTTVEAFEKFLGQTFIAQKRFSIEGTDMLVPMLDAVIGAAAAVGTREVVVGMAHRGRLNVLAHVLGKPYEKIFTEFREAALGSGPAPTEGINRGWTGDVWTGDVKYHLGATSVGSKERVTITLASNPSHLEFINPVIEGMARAAQENRDLVGIPRQDESAALPIVIHGDAAFPGEGVVAETLNLSGLPGYRTGGTIHIIVNNQLGFTTVPHDSRSTLYASDLARGFEIPIVHVNADDPPACLAAIRLAHAYRERFHKDVLIDLVGYRRWGHNESDEPAYTQPLLYEHITTHPTVRALWAQRLEGERLLRHGEADRLLEEKIGRLREINRTSLATPTSDGDENGHHEGEAPPPIRTAVAADELTGIVTFLLEQPAGFTGHPRLLAQLNKARQAVLDAEETKETIPWGLAEQLAFATILRDGTPIRFSGQDTERGTFSQRHLVLHDVVTGQTYNPLHALPQARASFAVYNSPLSEAGALGFEYGYSIHAPKTLVIWEAQFGDFANAAEVIIDQFIVAARAKWRQYPSLVLLLPHGYEGQGPEHSNARPERYLQLAAQDNLRVVNPTTAAQYFHLLRRQAALLESAARPLVVLTPKQLLRHPLATARLADLTDGQFSPVLDDGAAAGRREAVTRLVLCSGRVYVDLISHDLRTLAASVAVVRIEQLYPFPSDAVAAVLAAYPNLREVVWLQEEPRNMGAWSAVSDYLRALVGRDLPLTYLGRPERASPAVGSYRIHNLEQSHIVTEAFAEVPQTQKNVRGVQHVS